MIRSTSGRAVRGQAAFCFLSPTNFRAIVGETAEQVSNTRGRKPTKRISRGSVFANSIKASLKLGKRGRGEPNAMGVEL